MRHVRVKIKRDTNTMHNCSVPEWEVPILENIFEDGNVEVTDEFVVASDSEYPEANSEFKRLTDAYGKDPDSGVSYAALTYGNGGRGVKALRQAIEQSEEDEAKAVQEQKPASVRRSTKRSRDADSLLA